MADEGLFDRLAVNPLFNMGLGIMGANQGNYGAAAPALGRGALVGLANYQNASETAALTDFRKAQEAKWQQEAQLREMKARAFQGMQERISGQGGTSRLQEMDEGLLPFLEEVALLEQDSTLLLGVQRERRERQMMNPDYIRSRAAATQEGEAPYRDPVVIEDPYGRKTTIPRQQWGAAGAAGAPIAPAMVGPSPTRIDAIKETNTEFLRKTVPALEEQSATAKSLKDNVRAMREIGLKTGWGTETLGAGASILARLGVEDAAKYATSVQSFSKLAMDRLWETLNTAKGPQTEGDAQRAAKTYAMLGNTPEANEFILDYIDAVTEKTLDKSKFFAKGREIVMDPKNPEPDLGSVSSRWKKHDRSIWEYPQLQRWKKMAP